MKKSEFHSRVSELFRITPFANLIKTQRGRLIFTTLLFCFVFLTTYPKYLEILLDEAPVKTYAYFFEKIKSPLQQVQIAEDTHGSKVTFRLTVPILAKILNLGNDGTGRSIVIIYIIQSLLLFPFLLLLIKLLQRYADNRSTVLCAVSFSAVYVSKSFFWDYDFWFDGFAFFFLMLAMFLRNRLGLLFALLLACWTDERAVIALSSIYFFHILQETDFDLRRIDQVVNRNFFLKRSSIVILAGFAYWVVRWILALKFNLSTPNGAGTGVSLALIPFQVKHRLIAIFLSFEGLWLFFLYAAAFVLNQKRMMVLLVLCSIVAIHTIVAFSVFDITRSMAYAFPILIICAIIVSRNDPADSKNLFGRAAGLSLLIPTQFMIFYARQIPWTLFSYPELKLILKMCLKTLSV